MRVLPIQLAIFLIAVSTALRAGTIAFPDDDPCFNVTLPGGWKTHTEKDGSIKIAANDTTRLVTIVRRVTAVHTDDQLRGYLPKTARAVAAGLELKNIKIGEVNETTTPNKVTIFELKMTGTEEDGSDMVLKMSGFSPKKGTYFIASASTQAQVFNSSEKEYAQVVNAIAPMP